MLHRKQMLQFFGFKSANNHFDNKPFEIIKSAITKCEKIAANPLSFLPNVNEDEDVDESFPLDVFRSYRVGIELTEEEILAS